MNYDIKSIYAVTDILLSLRSEPCTPINPIWPNTSMTLEKRGSLLPAAFRINKKKISEMKVIIEISDMMPGSYTFRLEGFGPEKAERILFSGETSVIINKKSIKDETEGSSNKIELVVSTMFNPVHFFRLEGNILWRLKYKTNTTDYNYFGREMDTYLELFWIYDYDHILFCRGVPVEFLRCAALGLKIIENMKNSFFTNFFQTAGQQNWNTDPAIAAIVYVCFLRNPPRFDSGGGGMFYIKSSPDLDHVTFSARKYLESINEESALCNCSDMAAIVQVHLKAIGIGSVKLLHVKPFGYLRLTQLIGRGISNSPFYTEKSSKDHDLVVDEHYEVRSLFGYHTICFIPNEDDNELDKSRKQFEFPYRSNRVLDACVGPHLGNENIEEYMSNTFDYLTPALRSDKGYRRLKLYNGVISIDYIASMEKKKKTHLSHEFIELLGKKDETEIEMSHKNQEPKFVVCSWREIFESESISNISLGKLKKVSDIIIVGANEVIKTWKYQNDCEFLQIEVDLFTYQDLSKAASVALNNFLQLGNSPNKNELPYSKCEEALGLYSVMIDCFDYKQFIWVRDNVIFRITSQCNTVNVSALCKKIDTLADSNRKDCILEDIPFDESLSDTVRIVEVGEEFDVGKKSEDVLIDFRYKRCEGIQLLSGKVHDIPLTFIAQKESINIIEIALVKKNTLLANCIDLTVIVKSK